MIPKPFFNDLMDPSVKSRNSQKEENPFGDTDEGIDHVIKTTTQNYICLNIKDSHGKQLSCSTAETRGVLFNRDLKTPRTHQYKRRSEVHREIREE